VADGFELTIIDVSTSIGLHKERPKAFTAPYAYQANSRLAEYCIVRNDTAHVERSHNILVPY